MINRVQSKVRRPKKLASKANLVTQQSSHLSTMALSFISQASLKGELYILTSFRYSSTQTELQMKRRSSMTRLSRGSSRKLATAHVLTHFGIPLQPTASLGSIWQSQGRMYCSVCDSHILCVVGICRRIDTRIAVVVQDHPSPDPSWHAIFESSMMWRG